MRFVRSAQVGDLTKNLSRHEFACKCECGYDTVDFLLPEILQDVCDHFAEQLDTSVRIDVRSGNRCPYHNEVVQSLYTPNYVPYTSKSQHLDARAADFKLFIRHSGEQIAALLIHDYLCKRHPNKFGFGLYNNRNHADSRTNGPERWDKRGDS